MTRWRSWLAILIVGAVAACAQASGSISPSASPSNAASAVASPVASASAASSASASPVDGRFLGDIALLDGRTIRVACRGAGSPTVILDAGLGGGIESWSHVFAKIAEFTHVCSYDRAGVGDSSPVEGSKTTSNIVADLRAWVAAAGILGPFVLVGHSVAGLHLRLMAGEHAEELAGVLFVDTTDPTQNDVLLAALPPATADDPNWLVDLRGYFAAGWPVGIESYDIGADIELVEAITSFGDLPVIVLTAGMAQVTPDAAIREQLDAIWVQLHDDLAAMSTQGRNEIVSGARHGIQDDRPAAVVDAVRELVEGARG
jgi:pimeloyl-ACP methyl ester carboxylesterase